MKIKIFDYEAPELTQKILDMSDGEVLCLGFDDETVEFTIRGNTLVCKEVYWDVLHDHTIIELTGDRDSDFERISAQIKEYQSHT